MHNSQNNLAVPPAKINYPGLINPEEAALLLPLVLCWAADQDNWQQIGTVARRVMERALSLSADQ